MHNKYEYLRERRGDEPDASTLSQKEEEDFIENLRRRLNKNVDDAQDADSDDDEIDLDGLPFGGKVYLPRRKKPDSYICITIQLFLVVAVVFLGYYMYYYYDHVHVNVIKAYAHLGFDAAQHELGNRYLHGSPNLFKNVFYVTYYKMLYLGVGVERNGNEAMHWFKKAADQGHPHSSYNLAIGHLKGLKTPINQTYVIVIHRNQSIKYLKF